MNTGLKKRRNTVPVKCGEISIGGDRPVWVQTMTKARTHNVDCVLAQIKESLVAGADMVRVAIPDEQTLDAFAIIKKNAKCPIVADIHFDYKLALGALERGADKVRVNPGNIGGRDKLLAVAKKARELGSGIRIGVNSGSLEEDLLAKYGGPTPQAMVESVTRHLRYLEDSGVDGIVISLKSSSVSHTIEAYTLMAQVTSWPFHIGITEAGPGELGIIKSATGIAGLLTLGIGDTVRVSLTAEPVEEVRTGRRILQYLGLRQYGPELISCPTCGRTSVDLMSIVKEVGQAIKGMKVPIKIAVMGCPVNGPGEAREADLGIACGRDGGYLFSHGEVLGRVSQDEMVSKLMELVKEEEMNYRRDEFGLR